MSWVATAIVGTGLVSSYTSKKATDKAVDATQQATAVASDAEQQKLDYLKQINALPQEVRDQALRGLSDYYQVPGQAKDQQTLISEAMNSPVYASIMGTKDDALDSIARYSSATGGFRSGNAQVNLGRESQKISNQALLDSYDRAQADDRFESNRQLAGLSGLAGINTGAGEIASAISSVGNTKANGIAATGQTQQQGTQNMLNNLLGIAGLGVQAYGMKNPQVNI